MASRPRPAHVRPVSATMEAITTQLEGWLPALTARWRAVSAGAQRAASGPLTEAELEQAARGVRRLSAGLTRERALVGQGYMEDPELLGAYLLFYWPCSYAQVASALLHLPDEALGQALELGAGPGPGAAALLDRGAQRVTAWDHSGAALEALRAVASSRHAPARVQTRVMALDRGPIDAASVPKAQVIVSSHAVHELWAEQGPSAVSKRAALLTTLAQRSEASWVALVEPALRETSRGLLQLRQQLIERGFTVQAPCLHQGPCPALERERDWCHGEVFWRAPAWVQALAQRAGLNKATLPTSYLVLRSPGPPTPEARPQADAQAYRIVSEALHSKGRLHVIGCGPAGRHGLTLLERDERPHHAPFARAGRYDLLRLEQPGQLKGDGLRLSAQGAVRLVELPFGQPPWDR